MLCFVTDCETYSQALVAWIGGFPAGMPLDFEFIQGVLRRRRPGHARGERWKARRLNRDRVKAAPLPDK
jgi:chorismate synthase